MPRVRIGPLKSGGLHGWYHAQDTETRRNHIKEAVKADGFETTEKRLNALTVLDRSRNPRVAQVAQEDKHWLEHEYRG